VNNGVSWRIVSFLVVLMLVLGYCSAFAFAAGGFIHDAFHTQGSSQIAMYTFLAGFALMVATILVFGRLVFELFVAPRRARSFGPTRAATSSRS
jgi:hypothetical protein